MSCVYHKKACINKCYFCGENHTCRECPLEAMMAPILKKKVGILMEHYVANNFHCPQCSGSNMKVIGNHSPSLDIICSDCNKKIEVKSKCLSVNNLPSDIRLPHGNYSDYLNRLNDGLDLIVVIYGVDRSKKLIKIREVLHASTQMLNNKSIISVEKRTDNNLSTILIKNRNCLINLSIPSKDRIIDFSSEIYPYITDVNSKTCRECSREKEIGNLIGK